MSLGASVRSGNCEFGDAGSVAFVMTFSFQGVRLKRDPRVPAVGSLQPDIVLACRMSRPLATNTTCSAMFLAWSPMRSSPLSANTVSIVTPR
jgi:hypothetical protein